MSSVLRHKLLGVVNREVAEAAVLGDVGVRLPQVRRHHCPRVEPLLDLGEHFLEGKLCQGRWSALPRPPRRISGPKLGGLGGHGGTF